MSFRGGCAKGENRESDMLWKVFSDRHQEKQRRETGTGARRDDGHEQVIIFVTHCGGLGLRHNLGSSYRTTDARRSGYDQKPPCA